MVEVTLHPDERAPEDPLEHARELQAGFVKAKTMKILVPLRSNVSRSEPVSVGFQDFEANHTLQTVSILGSVASSLRCTMMSVGLMRICYDYPSNRESTAMAFRGSRC